MIQSIAVYGFMIISMMFLGVISIKRKKYYDSIDKKMPFLTVEVFLSLIIFSLFSGMRYEVGVDYEAYAENFYLLANGRQPSVEIEPLFEWITQILSNSGLSVVFYFSILSFIQLYFVLKAFENYRFIYPFLFFSLMTNGTYFMWMNGIRQMIVAALFIYSVKYIYNRQLIPYFLLIIIGSFIHKSSLLLLPFYFFVNLDVFKSKILQFSLLLLALIFSYLDVWSYLLTIIERGIMLLNYDNYEQVEYQIATRDNEFNRSIRFFIPLIVCAVLIIFSRKIKDYFSDSPIVAYYNIHFIGSLAWIIFFNNPLLQRPFVYFIYSTFIISGFLFVYLWQNLKRKILFQTVFLLFGIIHLLILYAYIISDFYTQYHFIWEKGFN